MVASAQKTTVRSTIRKPGRSPIDRYVLTYEREVGKNGMVAEKDREAHIGIYGNVSAKRSDFGVRLLETVAQAGDEVFISITTNGCTQGIGDTGVGDDLRQFGSFETLVFGKGVRGFDVTHLDGAALARLAIDPETPRNIVCDVRHFLDKETISKFLYDLCHVIQEESEVKLTLHLDIFQILFQRRRHSGLDSRALEALSSITQLGYDKKIKIIATASSPDEIPVEIRNDLRTKILVRMTELTQTRAIDKLIPLPLTDLIARDYGIGKAADGQGWILPGENIHPDHLLYLPLPVSLSNAGTGNKASDLIPAGHDAAVETLLKARTDAEAAKKKEQQDKQDARNEARLQSVLAMRTRTAHARPAARRPFGGMGSSAGLIAKLAATGVSYYLERCDIARVALNIQKYGSFEAGHKNAEAREQLSNTIVDPSYALPAAWMRRGKGSNRLNIEISLGMAAYAYMTARREDATKADAFFDGMTQKGDGAVTAALRAELATMTAPMRSQERLDAIMMAWRAYVLATGPASTPVPTAANDDVAIAQAI